ncbi:MAG TPA: tetratricopeptide repeat protein [Candidatus Caccocola faecipullorum]|nr:tetratricopeptide repeat protein [Candidatus Caccocola faecipullorum]
MPFDDDEDIKCPETVPEEQKGLTEAERSWSVKKTQRPRVPRSVFIAAALLLLAAFAGGGWWYYRTNVLPEEYYMRAAQLFKAGDYAGAEELFDKIKKLRPERRDLFYYKAYCREQRGDKAAAVKYYEEHLKTEPEDVKAMVRLGWLYLGRGDYNAALKWFREAAKREKKDAALWRMTAEAAEKSGDRAEASAAWLAAAKSSDAADDVMSCGKALLRIGDYRAAMTAYELAAKAAPDDKAPLHGLAAAKAMLGLPTNPRLVIAPGEALGAVKLGATKAEAKAAMDGRSPDAKQFGEIGGKSMLAGRAVEIWSYDGSRAMRIIFIGGEVHEIETASPLYKTEEGLGLSNFLLAKNSDKLKEKRETREGVLVCPVKGGGLTFYAYGIAGDGASAEETKLRVHRGAVSIDGANGFPLMTFGSAG